MNKIDRCDFFRYFTGPQRLRNAALEGMFKLCRIPNNKKLSNLY